MTVAGTTNYFKSSENKHKKDDDSGSDVDVGEDVVEQITGITVGVGGIITLKIKFFAEVETVCHGESIAYLV